MWRYYNPNPAHRNAEDCAIRALSAALDVDWETAFLTLTVESFNQGDMPHSNSALAAVLKRNGFYKQVIPDTCPDCYTAEDFCNGHKTGTYVLGFGRHVATVIDGEIFDSWDSRQEVPVYVWMKGDGNAELF